MAAGTINTTAMSAAEASAATRSHAQRQADEAARERHASRARRQALSVRLALVSITAASLTPVLFAQ